MSALFDPLHRGTRNIRQECLISFGSSPNTSRTKYRPVSLHPHCQMMNTDRKLHPPSEHLELDTLDWDWDPSAIVFTQLNLLRSTIGDLLTNHTLLLRVYRPTEPHFGNNKQKRIWHLSLVYTSRVLLIKSGRRQKVWSLRWNLLLSQKSWQ